MENETTKRLVNEIMSLSNEERETILNGLGLDKRDLRNLSWGDPEIVDYLIWGKSECIYEYLGDWYMDEDYEYHEMFEEEEVSFSEEEYDEVREFLNGEEYETIWSILELDRFETHQFMCGWGVVMDGYEKRQDYWDWNYEDIVEKVLGHPLYKSYKRDMKLQEIGL